MSQSDNIQAIARLIEEEYSGPGKAVVLLFITGTKCETNTTLEPMLLRDVLRAKLQHIEAQLKEDLEHDG